MLMKVFRLLFLALLLPLAAFAAERTVKIDKERSFVDVDVSVTAASFTGHLDAYEVKVTTDDSGKIKGTVFTFKFADLKTGNPDRDDAMIKWLGGGAPEGRYEMGNLAMAPDGQGQVSGRLAFHDVVELVEFPVNITRTDGTYTITGETTVDYRTWGLKVIRKMMFKVDPEVKVRFKLVGVLGPVEETKK
jgi:polyisoprenoid-binding protein YceI